MKFIIYTLIILSIASCDTAKQAIKHHNKAEALGYVYKCDPVTITLRDTIKGKDGKDSIVEVLVEVPCPKVEPPKTKWEIRHMAKAERDSMKHVENMLKLRNKILEDSLAGLLKLKQQETKQVESDNKTEAKINKPFPWGILLVVIGLLIILILYLIYKFKK